MTNPSISVVVAAWNEEAVIASALERMLEGAAPNELDVVVVCNGCTDATAARARAFEPRVRVLELDEPGKVEALAAGDAVALGYPRAYVDADVAIDVQTLRALAGALADGTFDAAAPAVRVDASRSSWPVRAYVRIWSELPRVRHGLAGRGAYALSRRGRMLVGSMAGVTNDDGYVDAILTDRAVTLTEHHTVVTAPRELRDVVRRRVRVHLGNEQLRADGVRSGEHATSVRELASIVWHRPSLALPAVVFVLVTIASRLEARRTRRAGSSPDWAKTRREVPR